MANNKIPDTIPPNRFDALVERVLSSTKIGDVIAADHVRVVTSDGVSTAVCPFHSPQDEMSLIIDTDANKFNCTVCGFKGTAIGWAMYYNGIDFLEAIVDLAAFADIPYEDVISSDDIATVKQKRNRLMRSVVDGYQNATNESAEASEYLSEIRCIDDVQLSRFGIGWCARGRLDKSKRHRDLWRYRVLGRNAGGDFYPRFGGRVVFPIRDIDGHIVGFGGRLLKESKKAPKYLNSATSRYFQKQNILYGLYESLAYSRCPDRFYVVEGYLDVIAMHQANYRSTVATLGTAINCTQILQLFRFTDRISLCFDLDKAGSDATLNAITQALPVMEEGQSISVITLPQGSDPDSFLKAHGASEFSKRIESASSIEVWLRERLIRDALEMKHTSRTDSLPVALPPETALDVSTRARVAIAFSDLLESIETAEIRDSIRQVAESTVGTRL